MFNRSCNFPSQAPLCVQFTFRGFQKSMLPSWLMDGKPNIHEVGIIICNVLMMNIHGEYRKEEEGDGGRIKGLYMRKITENLFGDPFKIELSFRSIFVAFLHLSVN